MKSIKIILLSFGLAASLAVTSYAMSPNENESNNSNIFSDNENNNNNIFSYNENNNNNIFSDNEEIDTSKGKNTDIETVKFCGLIDFYNNYLRQTFRKRKYIKNRLDLFESLCPVDDENELTKDISKMSISTFNILQNILLEYYNFSVLFTTKYSPFITLGKAHTKKRKEQEKYASAINTTMTFIKEISKYVEILNNFCYKLLFDKKFNPKIQNVNDSNLNLDNAELQKLPGLTTELGKIFETTGTKITQTSQLWGNRFSINQFTNNNFMDENTEYNKFEVTPIIIQDYEIPTDLKDEIPQKYKINSHILAAVYKMELLKSQYYMKKLKDDPSNNENVFESYDKAKEYTNDIFKTYNSLRSLIVLDKKLSFIGAGNMQSHIDASYIFSKDAASFNKNFEKYTSNDTNKVYDLISLLDHERKKSRNNRFNKTVVSDFIDKSDFSNKHQINSIQSLYDHISTNQQSYEQLLNINDTNNLKEFYEEIDKKTKSTNTKPKLSEKDKYQYQSLDSYLGRCVDKGQLDILKDVNLKNEKMKTTRDFNLRIAQGLLGYYNQNWRFDLNRINNIAERLTNDDFIAIYNRLNSEEKIQKNANLLNRDFNSWQSILLDYYKFLLFFSKYNNLIKMITTKTSKMKNYGTVIELDEHKSFMEKYRALTNTIKKSVEKIKTFVNETLTKKFQDPQNTNNALPDENNLKQLLQMSQELLKLEPNFTKIFKIMGIDKITGNKILSEETSLETIDRIPAIDPKKYTNVYLINAAPPHYRVNLDILATILKMEIVKWLPYFQKMPNTTVLNDQGKDTDINFTQSKQKMGNYINKIYQFYDNLRSYMAWSMNKPLIPKNDPFSLAYAPDDNKLETKFYPISEVLGKDAEFVKKIQDYIEDKDQFYTTLYFPPDDLSKQLKDKSKKTSAKKDSSKDESKKTSTKKDPLKDESKKTSTKKDPLKDETKQLSANLFKLYYDKRQNCVYKDKVQTTLLAKHILDKEEIYDKFMNNNNPNISDMKFLDYFFSALDPNHFRKLFNKDDDQKNPFLLNNAENVVKSNKNEKYVVKRNKNNKKSIAEQFKEIKPKTKKLKLDSLTYNNNSNRAPMFKNNYAEYDLGETDFGMFENDVLFNNYFLDQDNYETQPMQNNLPNLGATGFNSTTKQRQFNRNAKQVNNNALVEDFNLDPSGLGHFINLPFEENNSTDTNNRRFKILNSNNALNQQNIMSEDDKNRFDDFLKFINNPNKQNTQNARFEDNVNENFEDLTKRDKNQQYDKYHQFDENESGSEDSILSGIVTNNLGGAKKRGAKKRGAKKRGAKKIGGAKIEGGTKIKIMLNNESEESYNSSDSSYHIRRKKGKKSKKTKSLLRQKTFRKD